MKVCSVILAGGSGSRLWPASRSMRPKQFLPLLSDLTMLQSTIKRLEALKLDSSIIICNEEHRFFVAEQLAQINHTAKIIIEPEGRNTAPAIALAAHECDEGTLILVSSADHDIKDEISFTDSIKSAYDLANSGKFITFGIVPDKPHTGYGYIKKGKTCAPGFKVEEFVEKPNLETAKGYIDSEEFCWNSGIFLFESKNYLNELKNFRPDISKVCEEAVKERTADHNFIRINDEVFLTCPSDSIDYAVMENTKNAVVIPISVGWSDIGSWASLWENKIKDIDNNYIEGDVITKEVKDSLVISEDRLVTLLGVEDLIVVSTKDSILITTKDKSEEVKAISEELKIKNRTEHLLDREVYRPWGKYDSIDNGSSFQVKRITVKPGEKLSIQRHQYRSEHWIVVEGRASVTKNDEVIDLDANQSTYIPVGMIHALENKEDKDLVLIEIQTGTYFGEDDIERFEDIYGRT